MFIAFSFGAFIEGAAGFGAPVARFRRNAGRSRIQSVLRSRHLPVANTAPVAFGSIGTPILTLANVHRLPLPALSSMVGRLCAMLSVSFPPISWS